MKWKSVCLHSLLAHVFIFVLLGRAHEYNSMNSFLCKLSHSRFANIRACTSVAIVSHNCQRQQELYSGSHSLGFLRRPDSEAGPPGIPVLKVTNWKNSRLELITYMYLHYCQKVSESGSFLSTAQNSIVIAFKFTK